MKLRTCVFAALCLASSANAANYCMAIRGNGEIEPAHWGAMAAVVESLGLPQAQAGGSSASISMFLLDAIATNKFVKDVPGHASEQRAALMLKSLQGFLGELAQTSQWRDFMALYKRGEELKNAKWSRDLSAILDYASKLSPEQAREMIFENQELIKMNYQTGMKLGLINQRSYQELFDAVERLLGPGRRDDEALTRDLKIARFYAGELYHAVAVFGAFNAQTDENIFFRPGVVDFERLAQQFGRVADFYALANLQPEEEAAWQKFLQTCTKPALGRTWENLLETAPECGPLFSKIFQAHFTSASNGGNFANNPIGVTIPSYPTTAVLTGSAAEEARTALAEYARRMDSHFGKNFKLSHPEDVKFGYWGREETLNRVAANLDRRDEKSRRFLNLGQANWSTALGLSPAEPGLSPLKNFSNRGEAYVSAGGWSDLHPVLVLRAAGCENVVYVTRRGGESLFGQGVAKRLLGYDRDWSLISTSSPEAKKASAKLNNTGDASDMTSLWSRLYNLANPNSSIKRALGNADAVLCTNWDAFDIKNGVSEMIRDSYSSSFYVNPRGGLRDLELAPQIPDVKVLNADGAPAFAGCY